MRAVQAILFFSVVISYFSIPILNAKPVDPQVKTIQTTLTKAMTQLLGKKKDCEPTINNEETLPCGHQFHRQRSFNWAHSSPKEEASGCIICEKERETDEFRNLFHAIYHTQIKHLKCAVFQGEKVDLTMKSSFLNLCKKDYLKTIIETLSSFSPEERFKVKREFRNLLKSPFYAPNKIQSALSRAFSQCAHQIMTCNQFGDSLTEAEVRILVQSNNFSALFSEKIFSSKEKMKAAYTPLSTKILSLVNNEQQKIAIEEATERFISWIDEHKEKLVPLLEEIIIKSMSNILVGKSIYNQTRSNKRSFIIFE
jgi:hypothetical protein